MVVRLCCLNGASQGHENRYLFFVQHHNWLMNMTFHPQPDLQKSTVTGQGLQLAETGQQAHFEVHLVDTAGDPCTTEQQVTAELRSNMDGSITLTSVARKTPDTYEVSYQPNTRGRRVECDSEW